MVELVILLLLPIALALPLYLLGRYINKEITKWGAVATMAFTTIYSAILWIQNFVGSPRSFDENGFLLFFQTPWIESAGITFSLGVDGLSMPLLLLTQVVFLVSIVSSFYIKEQETTYYAMLLVLLSGITGTFVALDMFLFYIAWELVLVPMFFIIHMWGGPNRRYASMMFFIYTHLASLVMLIGLFFIYINGYEMVNGVKQYTFFLPDLRTNLATNSIPIGTLSLIFWLVFIGFVVKFPQVPVHTWLPQAHVEAPSPGSAILAGLLLKMGGYGLFRIPFWLFSEIEIDGTGFFLTEEGKQIRVIIAFIGVVSMVYPAFIALRQDDLKRMIAYSSISHMGIVLLGLAAYNEISLNGAMYMMIAHGVISPGLFLLSGLIEHNTKNHTRNISQLGGMGHKLPFATGLFVFLGFASAGLPGLAGFIAEFTVFVGLFTDDLLGLGSSLIWIPVIAVISIIITAGYYLWAMQRVLFNETTEEFESVESTKWYETGPIFVLSILTLVLGLLPAVVWWVLDEFSGSILP